MAAFTRITPEQQYPDISYTVPENTEVWALIDRLQVAFPKLDPQGARKLIWQLKQEFPQLNGKTQIKPVQKNVFRVAHYLQVKPQTTFIPKEGFWSKVWRIWGELRGQTQPQNKGWEPVLVHGSPAFEELRVQAYFVNNFPFTSVIACVYHAVLDSLYVLDAETYATAVGPPFRST